MNIQIDICEKKFRKKEKTKNTAIVKNKKNNTLMSSKRKKNQIND